MARTGRFGRLPSQAPDLTASIVSMMEQYQNARDANIYDAWKNGGEFEGKPVNDKMFLAYVRERRDMYERSDPEWDEWDNSLWQYRFTIAEEKALLRYKNAMAQAAGYGGPLRRLAAERAASAGMEGFYRTWSHVLPQNSSAYRDLQTKAAEYAKAVALASSRARGIRKDRREAREEANKPSEAEIYVSRRDAIQREMVDPFMLVKSAIDAYAISRGIMAPGETVADLSVYESSAFSTMLDGLAQSPQGRSIIRQLRRRLPPGSWDGELDAQAITKFSRLAERGIKQQIALARDYPADMSGVVAGLKNDLRGVRQARLLDEQLRTSDLLVNTLDDFNNDMANADTPWARLEARADALPGLKKALQQATAAKDWETAGQIENAIRGIRGSEEDITFLNKLEPSDLTPMWGGEGGPNLLDIAYEKPAEEQQADLMTKQEGYLVTASNARPYNEPIGRGYPPPAYEFRTFADQPQGADQDLFAVLSEDGKHLYPVLAGKKPIFITDWAEQPSMYVSEVNGNRHYSVPILVANPDGTLHQEGWDYIDEDAVERSGIGFTQRSDGSFVMTGRPSEQRLAGIGIYSPEEQVERAKRQAEAKADLDDRLSSVGLEEVAPGDYRVADQAVFDKAGGREVGKDEMVTNILNASRATTAAVTAPSVPPTASEVEANREATEKLGQNLASWAIYGVLPEGEAEATQSEAAWTQPRTDVDELLDPQGIPGLYSSVQMAKDTPGLHWASSVLAGAAADPQTWRAVSGQKDWLTELNQKEPGWNEEKGYLFEQQFSQESVMHNQGAQAAALSVASGPDMSRAEAGFRSGAAQATTQTPGFAFASRVANAATATEDERVGFIEATTGLQRASARDASEQQAALNFGFTPRLGGGTPTDRANVGSLPAAVGGAERTTPDVVLAPNLAGLAMGGRATQTGPQRPAPDVSMAPNLDPSKAITKPPKQARSQPIKSPGLSSAIGAALRTAPAPTINIPTGTTPGVSAEDAQRRDLIRQGIGV
jgi:hypothetical protein